MDGVVDALCVVVAVVPDEPCPEPHPILSRTLPARGRRGLVAGEHVTLATQERVIVYRLRKRIEQRRSKSAASLRRSCTWPACRVESPPEPW